MPVGREEGVGVDGTTEGVERGRVGRTHEELSGRKMDHLSHTEIHTHALTWKCPTAAWC